MTKSPPTPTEALHQMMEGMHAVLDAVDGYRAECLRRGYNETAAEVMAMDFHRMMLNQMSGAKQQ